MDKLLVLILFRRIMAGFMAGVLAMGTFILPGEGQVLPAPGSRVALSEAMAPSLLKGVRVYPENPFRLDFILGTGSSGESTGPLEADSARLIRYFLTAVTVPEDDLWVNLSPYEKDRIIPDAFGGTEMGRDLLAQDYLLKQITASLLYPEGEIGKAFWARVYAEAGKRLGTADIPVDTFNKVWIVPQKAVVYESGNSAYVVESRLKVMLETDYIALNRQPASGSGERLADDLAGAQALTPSGDLAKDILREVVIPVLEKEVNEGKNFAQLRQVYNSLILAAWYKDRIKESLLGKEYADRRKVRGLGRAVDLSRGAQVIKDASDLPPEEVWQLYVEAFQKGAYNYIKEEFDTTTQQWVPRKYFSGGITALGLRRSLSTTHEAAMLQTVDDGQNLIVRAELSPDTPPLLRPYFEIVRHPERWNGKLSQIISNLRTLQASLVNRGLRPGEVVDISHLSSAVLKQEYYRMTYTHGEGFSLGTILWALRETMTEAFSPDHFLIFELLAHPDIAVDRQARATVQRLERYIDAVSEARESHEQIWRELNQENDYHLIAGVIKQLANMAEFHQDIPRRDRARDFLEYFLEVFLDSHRDLIETFLALTFDKVRNLQSQYPAPGALKVAVLYTGAEPFARLFRDYLSRRGSSIRPGSLFLTRFMLDKLDSRGELDELILPDSSQRTLRSYLRNFGIIDERTKALLLVDTGFKGTMKYYVSKALGADMDINCLLFSHETPDPDGKIFGLNETEGMLSRADNIKKFVFLFEEALESSTTSPANFGTSLEMLGAFPSARPWYHALINQKIDGFWDAPRSAAADPAAVTAGNTGGIDLTRDQMPLQIQERGQNTRFTFDSAMIQKLQSSFGLTPVIIDIYPMKDLKMFLGQKEEADAPVAG